jgi:hypothetical protein
MTAGFTHLQQTIRSYKTSQGLRPGEDARAGFYRWIEAGAVGRGTSVVRLARCQNLIKREAGDKLVAVRWLPLLLPRLRRTRYASTLGLDIRFAVTSLMEISAEHVYAVLCCARGQAENTDQPTAVKDTPKSRTPTRQRRCRPRLSPR